MQLMRMTISISGEGGMLVPDQSHSPIFLQSVRVTVSEYKTRTNNSHRERPSSFLSRIGGYCISAIDGKRKFRIPHDFHNNGRRAWFDQLDFVVTWHTYRIAISFLSAAAFGIGIGEITLKIMRMQ